MIVKKKYYSHEDLIADCHKIIRETSVNKENFTHIVGVNRGGLMAGMMLSHYWDIPLIPFRVSLRDHRVVENGDAIRELLENDHNHILVLDDICDSGDTLLRIYKESLGIELDDPRVKTAVLVHNLGCKTFEPDYYGHEINKEEQDFWIVFWWENWWE